MARVTSSRNRSRGRASRPSGGNRPALPAGNRRALPPGPGGTPPPAGVRQVQVTDLGSNYGRQLSGGSRPALPGTNVRGRLPGGTGGADRVTGSGTRTGRPAPNRPGLPPGRSGALATTPSRADAARARAAQAAAGTRGSGVRVGQPAASRTQGGRPANTSRAQAVNRALQNRGGIVGGALSSIGYGAAFGLLEPQALRAGQWLGRNVLLPMVDKYEDSRPGIQSDRERRRRAVNRPLPATNSEQARNYPRLGRNGDPAVVPNRPSAGSRPSGANSRPSGGSSTSSRYQGGNDTAAPRTRPAAPPTRPAAASTRQQPASAPPGMRNDPLQGRNGSGFQTPGSPLTAEPAPTPGSKPQAPVTASNPSFRGPGQPQPLPSNTPLSIPTTDQNSAAAQPSGSAASDTPKETQKPAAASQSSSTKRPSRGPTGREEMIAYNIQRARRKRNSQN